jgi:hypothetical protein
MTRLIIAAIATLVLASTASATGLPGKRVAGKTVSGEFAVAAIHATVKHPHGLYLRLAGRINSGMVVVGCSRNFSISSNSYKRNRAGLYRIPIKPSGADSCQLVASAGGSGRITVELRAR